jgi:hypothetical protein
MTIFESLLRELTVIDLDLVPEVLVEIDTGEVDVLVRKKSGIVSLGRMTVAREIEVFQRKAQLPQGLEIQRSPLVRVNLFLHSPERKR